VLASSGVRAASQSVVKVVGTAGCGHTIEGSGFVFAAHHVITNAHVVAGVRGGPVVFDRSGHRWHATVVFYDPETDIAVLDVPGLGLRTLKFATSPAHQDAEAAVAGYQRNQGFTTVAARVGPTLEARGLDIYRSRAVTWQIYAIRAPVQPGNSGGSLLDPDGAVYGVVFAAVAGQPNTGYALTYTQVAPDRRAGMAATAQASTQGCG
jgi:S1-C subfamily serine protease